MKLKAALLFLLVTTSLVDAQNYNLLDAKENHAPVFVKEMPDTFILAGKTLLFQYKATDQDGDSISYSVKSVLPMNATLLPKTGVFSWRPTNSQQGKYELIVSASDGKLFTDSRKVILETTYLWDDFGSGTLTINVSHGIGGEVEKHINNDTALVRAIPYKGYRFTSWTEKGIIVSTDSIYKFRITVSRDLLANFRINHAPVFVKEMPDTTLYRGLAFPFTYKAIDSDGDSVKYSVQTNLESYFQIKIDSVSGYFVCRPFSVSQGKSFELIIAASDGILKTLSRTAILYVHVTSVEQEKIPTTFSLSQNFPNPFNPSTTISFSIPKSELVTLKVFDVLGREVATIVDEYKQAGTYKANFNASGLVSGVYFYQLSGGSYVETKKLILMK